MLPLETMPARREWSEICKGEREKHQHMILCPVKISSREKKIDFLKQKLREFFCQWPCLARHVQISYSKGRKMA